EAAAANLVYALPEGASEDELDLRLHVDPVRAETLEEAGFEWAEVLQGEARGHLRLHGPPDALRIDGRLETEGGRVRLEGALPVEGATRIRVDTEGEAGLRLDRVLDDAPPVAVRGRFELEAEGEADPRVRVDLEPFTFGELEVPAVEAEGVLGEEGVTVERARARIAGDDVILRGTVGYDGSAELEVEGDVRRLQDDPTVARLAPDLRGGVGFRMRVEAGAEGELALRGRWVFRNLRYPPLEVRRLVAIGTVGGDLASPALGLDLGFEGVRVGGAPLGDGDGRIDGDAGAYRARLALATPQRRIVIEGAELRIGEALRVDAEAVELRAAGQTWTGRVDGLVARGSDLEVATLALRDGEQRITLSGRWRRGRGRDDALRAEAWNVQIGDVLALLQVPELDLDGRVDGTAELTGDLEGQPAIDVDATIADLRLAENMGFQSSVLARYRAGHLEVDWGLTHASGTAVDLDLEGTLDTGSPFLDALSTAAYAGTLQVRHLNLARIRTVTDAVPPLEGHAGGLLTFSGGIDAFDFDLRAEVPRLQVGDLPAIGLAANVGYREGALILRALTRDDGGALIEAEAAALLDLLGVLEDPSLLPMLLDVAPWRLALRFPPRDLGTLPEPLRALLPLSEGLRGSATLSLRGGA
ncbi:MAG TPA: hypothetical protein RMI62_16370, partial [Polyangiaceae bacterium LLY-WYZ-15_(1-7)]|nr:hypothetical protein [Polyangiaceae bacterium LLY-WYZ-15_(1-7)]